MGVFCFFITSDCKKILKAPKVGDRVMFALFGAHFGSHSSRLGLRPRQVWRIPEPVDYDSAAGYLQGMGTAYDGIVGRLDVQPGHWVIVTGATVEKPPEPPWSIASKFLDFLKERMHNLKVLLFEDPWFTLAWLVAGFLGLGKNA